MTQINGRAAIVTGGGSGIGSGIARELGARGVAVAVADIRLEAAKAVAEAITAAGGRAFAYQCDVCEIAAMRDVAAAAKAAMGPASLVFANAGATSFDPLLDMSDADVDWIVQVNLMGAMNTVRAFLPDIVAEGRGGHICATASMAGLLPGWIPAHVPYSAAKLGIIGLMMNLALEMKPYRIFTTSYCPGGVASGMKANNATYRPARFGGPGEGEVHLGSETLAHTPGTFYTPEQIAPIVLNAVENNRPFVFDHAEQRPLFAETYADFVEACYDDIEAWEKVHGTPQAHAAGADL